MDGAKRILIADDDSDIAELVSNFIEVYFGERKHEIVVVGNGKDALQKALNENFDLIMLDVMMPYIDGYHVAYEVSEKKPDSKIIIMTSRDLSSEKGIALLSGANDVMQKPFGLDEMKAKIDALLGQKNEKGEIKNENE